MPRYLTAHVTSCMTRQDVEALARRLVEGQGAEVRCLRLQCDTEAARLVCEWAAPDRQALLAFLEAQRIKLRGESEWLMRVRLEAVEGRWTQP